MNRVYRLVWSHSKRAWVAVSELARGQGKRGSGVVMAAGLLSLPVGAFGAGALPSGGAVMQGQASISQLGSSMQINQLSNHAVINWNDFSIGRGASVQFNNANGATLNRVTGNLPSSINGQLSATGSLYLVNRNGVIVGSDGVINAAGFMATTLDVHDDDFMSGGGLHFFGDSRAGIVNLGLIQANTGNVVLVAHTLRNEGKIRATQGQVDMLAGQDVFLTAADAPELLISLGKRSASDETGVTNTGLIETAQARLQAADGNLYGLAINQSGVIRATGVQNKNGRIVLTADGGRVQQAGVLQAQNADGSGGEILVGGDYQGKNAAIANAQHTIVTADAHMDASATADKGDAGRVIVWADDSTQFAGHITARGGAQGGDGGFAEVSGKHTLNFQPATPIDLSAPKGKTGTVLLDPDEATVVTNVTGANQIAVAAVETGLASANYTISTSNFNPDSGSGNIDVQSDITWSNANTLTLQAGNAITINANITALSGALEMYAGRYANAPSESEKDDVNGGAELTAGHTIQTDRLRYGANASSVPVNYTLDSDHSTDSFVASGNLHVNTLELDLNGGDTGLETYGSNNAISTFKTVGTGPMNWVDITNHSGNLALNLQSTDAFGLQIVTPGNLTLQAGTQLQSTHVDFVLASTGGNFINNAGASALSLSGNARFLIYSGSQDGTVKGELVGIDEFSRTFAGNPPNDYNDDNSYFLYRSAAPSALPDLTYRANNLNRFYGDANPSLTYSVSGLQGSDVLENVVTGSPELSTTATLQSGVGQYTINISQGTLASTTYGFQFAPGTLTINAAPITVTIANMSRYYGDANPTFTANASGLKNGDSLDSALAGFTIGTSADRSSNVGDYAINGIRTAGDVNANYNPTFTPGILTINTAPVTLTLAPSTMVYGDTLPNLIALATLSNGDRFANAFPGAVFSTSATSTSPVGSYAVSVAGSLTNTNYHLTIGSIGNLTITKAPLVINANNASRIYGDANPDFSVASITGWKNGDTLADIPGLVLTSAAATSNVGNYAIVPSGSATNYDFVAGTGTLTINKAPVDVYLDAATRYYGDPDPLFTATYQGLKNGETALPNLHPVSNTDKYSKVGNHVISAGGTTTFQNYLPTFYAGVLTIAPRPLLLEVADASRTYGEPNPWLAVSVSGATEWDADQAGKYFAASTSATQRSDAGDYAIGIAPSVDGIGFNNLENYQLMLKPGILHIERAPIDVVANPVSIIWGDDVPPLNYTASGFMPWDDVNSAGKLNLTYASGDASAPPGHYAMTLSSAEVGKNYIATLRGTPFVDVQKRPITLYGDYETTVPQVSDIHAGRLGLFTVTKYDTDGRQLMFDRTTPLAEGPQFVVSSSSDGKHYTINGDPFTRNYDSMPFITPIMGSTMDDVLRYYDPVSVPGIAHATVVVNPENNQIYHEVKVEPLEVVVDKPVPVKAKSDWPVGENPSVNMMFNSIAKTPAEFRGLYEEFRDTGIFDAIGPDTMQLLRDADANEKAYATYKSWIEENEAWIANIQRNKPPHWEEMVAAAEADIVSWRAEMQAHPGLEVLRQRAAEGDPQAMAALSPLLVAGLMKSMKEGDLPPAAATQILESINQQRADLMQRVEKKHDTFLTKQKMREGSLTTLYSGTKMPDIVGQAYTDMAADQMAKDMTTTVFAASAITGGVVAGLAVSAAVLSTVTALGETPVLLSSLIYSIGSFGAAAPWAVAGVAVIIAGVAEGVQIVETEKNAARYESFKENNKQLDNLDNFDMKNKDNAMQAAQAIQALVLQSLEKSMVVPQEGA